MNPDEIEKLIEANLPDCKAMVASDDNHHYEATVVCAGFAGKRALARHQMIYATLGDKMGGEIHALAIKALTPDEYSDQ